MKIINKLLVLVLVAFTLVPSVYATSSKFAPKVKMESTNIDNNNYINLILYYSGESVDRISEKVTYNGRMLEFIDAEDINGFMTVTEVKTSGRGKSKILDITTDFNQDYDNLEYVRLKFKVLQPFKIGKASYMDIENIIGASEDGVSKYKTDGIHVTLNRETLNKVSLSSEKKSFMSTFKMLIDTYLIRFLFVLIIIIIIIIIIVLLPSKREIQSEHREEKIRKAVKGNPRQTQKIKVDIDDIKTIGVVPKAEPKNKLELGAYDPFKANTSKSQEKLETARDFKATSKDVFKDIKAPVVEPAKEVKKEEVKIEKPKEPIKRDNIVEGKDGLIMISSKKLDDANQVVVDKDQEN